MVPSCGFFPLKSSCPHRGVGSSPRGLSFTMLALALLGCLCSLTGTAESQMRQEANSPLYPGMSSSSLPSSSSSTSDGHPALVRRNFLRFGKRSDPSAGAATFMKDRVLRSGGQAALEVNGGPFRRDYREFVRFGKRSSGHVDAFEELLALEAAAANSNGRAKRVREPVIASDNRMVLPEDEDPSESSEPKAVVSEEEQEGARAAGLAMQQQEMQKQEQKRRDDFLRFGKRLLHLNNLLCSESGLCDDGSVGVAKPASLKQQQLQLRLVQQRLRQLREFDPAYLAKKSNDFLRFGRRRR